MRAPKVLSRWRGNKDGSIRLIFRLSARGPPVGWVGAPRTHAPDDPPNMDGHCAARLSPSCARRDLPQICCVTAKLPRDNVRARSPSAPAAAWVPAGW